MSAQGVGKIDNLNSFEFFVWSLEHSVKVPIEEKLRVVWSLFKFTAPWLLNCFCKWGHCKWCNIVVNDHCPPTIFELKFMDSYKIEKLYKLWKKLILTSEFTPTSDATAGSPHHTISKTIWTEFFRPRSHLHKYSSRRFVRNVIKSNPPKFSRLQAFRWQPDKINDVTNEFMALLIEFPSAFFQVSAENFSAFPVCSVKVVIQPGKAVQRVEKC